MLHVEGKSPIGLRVLHYVCLIFGFWIPIAPLQFHGNRLLSFAIAIYEWILNLCITVHFIAVFLMVFKLQGVNIISLCRNILPLTFYFPIVFASIFLHFNKKFFFKLLQNMQDIINSSTFKHHQSNILHKISKKMVTYMITTGFLTAISYLICTIFIIKIFIGKYFGDPANFEEFINSISFTYGTSKEETMKTFDVSFTFIILATVNVFLFVMKKISHDMLFTMIFSFIIEEIKLLRYTLNASIPIQYTHGLQNFKMYDGCNLQNTSPDFKFWLRYHHDVSK